MTKPPDYPDMPQHDKFEPHKDAGQAIGGFLDWLLNETPYVIAEIPEDATFQDRYFPVRKPIERWIAEYFGIDYDAYMREKDDLLKWWRKQQEEESPTTI